MDVLRRTVVLGGLLTPLVSVPRFSRGFTANGNTLFVVLDGIDTALSPQLAEQVLQTFFSNGIPVSVIIQCPRDENNASKNGFVQLFKGVAAKERGLFEAILAVKPTDESERYLQLREAIELRDCLEDASAENIAEFAPIPIVSLLNRGSKELWNPYALRAAGFRIQMRQNQDADSRVQGARPAFDAFDWGIGLMMAEATTLIESDPDKEYKQLEQQDGEQILYLSFRNANSIDPEELLTNCSAWAARLNAEMLGGNIFPTRPMDHLLQGHPGVSKYVGIMLDLTDPSGPTSHMLEFAESLEQAGFAYTALTPDGSSLAPVMAENCVINFDGADSSNWSAPRCVLWDSVSSKLHSQSAEIILERAEDSNIWSGPRSDGRYHAVFQTKEEINFLRNLEEDPLTDMIFLVESKHVSTHIQRKALLEQFEQARSDDRANFFSVRGYMNQTVAPDPVLERFWSTRRRQISDPPVVKSIIAPDEETFLDDARLAWQYFENYSDNRTGICAGTVQTGLTRTVNSEVTLWDVASQIHGLCSANALSIISEEEARNRIEKILDHLPTNKLDGLLLPPLRFLSNSSRITKRGFDSDDTGRFLISLRKVVDSGIISEGRAKSVLDQWDIASTVRDKQAFSHKDGAWINTTMSHGSHYARNGYIAWSIPMGTAYPLLSNTDRADQYIRLLYQAAFLGHFGTEPLLLEGVEVGHSLESKYLSDVLFDSQLSWFEETGQLKCVSEVSLNFSPWFSYQGLRVDRRGADAWVIATDDSSYLHQTENFIKKAEVISSKAAFLWAALYPHEYSSRLVELIREKARVENLGFSIGVFNNTQKPMEGYSDVNTNGIILTAIAKKLRKW